MQGATIRLFEQKYNLRNVSELVNTVASWPKTSNIELRIHRQTSTGSVSRTLRTVLFRSLSIGQRSCFHGNCVFGPQTQ